MCAFSARGALFRYAGPEGFCEEIITNCESPKAICVLVKAFSRRGADFLLILQSFRPFQPLKRSSGPVAQKMNSYFFNSMV